MYYHYTRCSKHEISTINMLYSLKKTTSPQQPLSSFPTVAIVERFDCINKFFHEHQQRNKETNLTTKVKLKSML